jgi:hypothetical protein
MARKHHECRITFSVTAAQKAHLDLLVAADTQSNDTSDYLRRLISALPVRNAQPGNTLTALSGQSAAIAPAAVAAPVLNQRMMCGNCNLWLEDCKCVTPKPRPHGIPSV